MHQTSQPSPSKKRVRLAPAVRKRQILDAALVEFSSHGFTATSIDKIARRVGLSKAGLYAHFPNKNAIFEALLKDRMLPAAPSLHWHLKHADAPGQAIRDYVDQLYAHVRDPDHVATFRLLIAESGRAPDAIQHWREQVLQGVIDADQRYMDEAVQAGTVRASAVTENVSLSAAPAIMAMVIQLIRPPQQAAQELDALRTAHQRMLHELLQL